MIETSRFLVIRMEKTRFIVLASEGCDSKRLLKRMTLDSGEHEAGIRIHDVKKTVQNLF